MAEATHPETDDLTIPAGIARRLRREILTGELPPGSPIKERDNADRLGISRTPLREAVRMLAKEGLVILRPLRSPVVADPDLDEMRDELAVLRILELASGELACRNATAEDIARVASLADAVARDYHTGDIVDIFDIDMEMHHAIVQAGRNVALIRTHMEYLQRLWRIRFISARQRNDSQRTLTDHAGMVEALSNRDAVALQAHIGHHMDCMLANIEDHFRKEAEPGSSQL